MKKIGIILIFLCIMLIPIFLKPKENILQAKNIPVEEETIEISNDIAEDTVIPTTYTEELFEFVKSKEGFYAVAYKNEGEEYWTIGYGHYGADVKEGQTITEKEAEKLLRQELDKACEQTLKYCDYLELNQSQLDSLTSFTFNGGLGLLQKLTGYKTRDINEIANHITAYTNHGLKGLVIRRNEEKNMLLNEV